MNKEEKKELIKTLSEMLNLMRGHQYNQEIFFELLDKIFSIVRYAIHSIKVISFFIILIFWRILLFDPLSAMFDRMIGKWSALSENYKILILGLIGTLIAGVFAQIVGLLLWEKIKSISKNKNTPS